MGNLARPAGNLEARLEHAAGAAARLRLLWISQNVPYPPKTGVLQRNYNLIREASTFADVHLVAILKQDILPTFEEHTAVRELKKICTRVDAVRLPVEESRVRFFGTVIASLFTRTPFTVNWATSPVLRDGLARALETGPFDVVYFDTISLAGYRGMMAGSALALNHHNIESLLFQRRIEYERHPLKRLYFGIEAKKLRRYEAEVAAAFDTHLVVSDLDGERLREIRPGISTTVVANGVDVDYFRSSGTAREPAHLVMVSGMNWFPNRDAVLFMIEQIWPRLSQTLPDARLTIVGASPPPAVTELAARDSRVRVTGFVDDVRPYMDRAQVYLCPMRDGGGTRLKILDALSMGVPIVSTTMGLEGIHVEPEHDVLVANTPEEFVTQIGRLTADAELRARLSANGRAFVEEHFAWSAIGRRMRDTFVGLARARKQHG
jgi:glycosyltransferase involved in cell wall biosynthesis